MSRYVDAEWLIKESMPLSFSVQKWVNEVQIMTAPSIDIVKCKECCMRGTEDCPMAHCNGDEDYCSFGLRMDCSLCWKESHCKAIKEAEKEELNETK